MRPSYILMLLGIVVMFFGAGATLVIVPLSTVEVGPVKIGGIDPFSAALIGVGAIIFITGVGLYLKNK